MIAVIGSGLGGLSAAVRLAQAGEEVHVFEQGHQPGGFAARFQRGDYTFEASLHALDAVGAGEPNALLLERLGLRPHLELLPLTSPRRERWLEAGVEVELPHGRAAWLEAFASHFPADREGAAALLALAERVHTELYRLAMGSGPPPDAELLRLSPRTAQELLESHVHHPVARGVLGSWCAYVGMAPDRLGAVPLLVFLHGYVGLTAAFVRGGSASLVQALVAELERLGGRLHLDTPVRGILCRRRRVTGLDVGEPLAARAVVANCSPLVTFGQLLPRAEVPPRLLAQLQAMEVSGSMVCLHLGVGDTGALPQVPYECFLHEVQHPALPSGRLGLTARHVADPSLCPPGGGVYEVATAGPNQDDTEAQHPELEEVLLELAERHLLPGLRSQVEVSSLVHPGTWVRYTGTPRAATFGFALTPAQSGLRGLSPQTAVEGLVQAGAWVRPGAGQCATMLSGWQAAEQLLRDGSMSD